MLLTIALIVLVLWALGAIVVPIGNGLIHVLLVVALVLVIVHLGQRNNPNW